MIEVKKIILVCFVVALCLLPTACRTRQVSVSAPTISPEALKYTTQGDAQFLDSHLYGWRQAESLYQRAYALNASDELRNKLLLTRFLILVRQFDEDIPNSAAGEIIKDLCAGDPYEKNLCAMAEWIWNGRKIGQLKLNGSIFRGQDPTLDSYIDLLLFKATPKVDAFSSPGTPDRAIASPLFLYLNTGRLTSMEPDEFERKYPNFAEGFEYLAENFFQKKKYRSALVFYQKAIDLIPEYTNALVGLGNIYFYVLEDYVRSGRYYDSALKRDPSCTAALFGKSMVLQQLGSYSESNAVLDRMLVGTVAKNRWIDGVPDEQYYKGQGNYLRAYNYYLMKDPAKARELTDTAKKFMRDTAEINYLSGLLFYDSGDLEAARRDFLRVTQMGNYNCNAQLNLGSVYEQLKGTYGNQPMPGEKEPVEKKSLQYFMAAGGCMDSVAGSLSYQIKTLDSMDLDPSENAALKLRLERKLADVRQSSCSTIEMLKARISNSQAPEKAIFLKYLEEILSRLRTP
jgi:tetratricopeptide (TPR) repeat protein